VRVRRQRKRRFGIDDRSQARKHRRRTGNAHCTGSLLNRVHYPEGERVYDTIVTQVAHKVGGRWQFVSFQITPKSD
jgi:hypothetical protein